MSLASRRLKQGDSRKDDAKGSIVGLSGWLFADLLLALAVVFLVASDRPAETGAKEDAVLDIGVMFSEKQNGAALTQLATIDETFTLWVRFSEPVDAETIDLGDFEITPDSAKDEWSYRIIEDLTGQVNDFQIRLNPEKAESTKFSLAVLPGGVLSASRTNVFNSAGRIDFTVDVCQSLAGIAVSQPETARFLISGGQRMDAVQLRNWLQSSERKTQGTDKRSAEDADFGDARLIWQEIQKPKNDRRKIGFAILFGGYIRNQESANEGQRRARAQSKVAEEALRGLGLIDDSKANASSCPAAANLPIRPFGDAGVGIDDLKFELYFYNNE